ncbi:MAG: branched-chain amino acid ABC transporter permease [Acidimicrobiia bacterium]
MTQVIQVVILGTLLGGVYALMASGLTILFGVMRVVNISHAAFIILGAFFTFFLWESTGLDPLLGMLVALPVFFVFGAVLYRALFPRVEGSPRFSEMTVLLTFGLAFMTEGLMTYFFTGIFRQTAPSYRVEAFEFGSFYVPTAQFYALLASVVLLVCLWAFLTYTHTGYGVRATMQNRMAAQIVGVDVRRVSTISFGIGMALAGAAGALVSFLFPFFPARHWQWIAILLSLIVLGGLGSLKGAVIGAIGLAVISAFVSRYIGPVWSPMVFYGALFIILLVRPQGLFGHQARV